MTLGPPLWATGTWAADAWADGTWSTTAAPAEFGDLTTLFVGYLETLRDTDLVGEDMDTLVALDLATVRAATATEDDMNTMFAEYLS
jgi:hypothetical protein